MSLEIDFENKEGYIHARVSGIFTMEGALPVFEKLLIYSTVTKTMKILIDCRNLEGEMPLEELMAFSQKSNGIQADYGDKGMINEMRLGYLFDPEKHDIAHISKGVVDPDRDDFIFTFDHEEAVNWLRSN